MIVSTSLAKVGHRQAPHSKKPHPKKLGWGFLLELSFLLLQAFAGALATFKQENREIRRCHAARRLVEYCVAGLLALLGRESGQVRKEAATATEASAGGRARHLNFPASHT